MKKIRIRHLKKIIWTIRCKVRKDIVVNAHVGTTFWDYKSNNFGDDINIPIIEDLTGRHVTIRSMVYGSCEELFAIGSIADRRCNKNAIIWGSGAMFGINTSIQKPMKVCAVRGILTRKYFLKQNIAVPEIYGDPALLLPYIYQSDTQKKYELGIIPHYVDFGLPIIEKIVNDNPNMTIINLRDYENWKDVVDVICSCKRIISSSLHGMIVSDAYKIPNIRVKFSDSIDGGDFKYKDYCSGIGRQYIDPIYVSDSLDFPALEAQFEKYKIVNFDIKPLLNAFPYKLTDKWTKILK